MTAAAAFFDLDRTLISGASAFPLGVEAWRQGLATSGDIGRWAVSALSFRILGDTGHATDDVKGDFLTRIAGSSVQALEMVGAAVLPKLVARVRPESRKLINLHHESGRDTWIVSAAPHEIGSGFTTNTDSPSGSPHSARRRRSSTVSRHESASCSRAFA